MQIDELIESVMEERLAELHTVALARIVTIDTGTQRASVKPLFAKLLQDGRSIPAPVIVGVPYITHRYEYTDTGDTSTGSGPTTTRLVVGPIYQAGDTVLIAYAERAIDASLTGAEAVPPYNRKHSIDDAVIIGRIGGA